MTDEAAIDYIFDSDDEREIEKSVGIEIYGTPEEIRIGGVYKHLYKDFVVKEILRDGVPLEIQEDHTITSFSKEKDQCTSFNLTKVNKDTFEAVGVISKALGIPRKIVKYHGLKDKGAITVQRITIMGNFIKELRELKLEDIFIRNIVATNRPARIGGNLGNSFNITIRDIVDSPNLEEQVKEIIDKLKKEGFPNYFGLQRFGTFRPNSHIVGRLLLEGRYKEAFEEFVLKTYTLESDNARQCRQNLKEDGDYERALEEFPFGLRYERTLIHYLKDNPNDYKGAFDQIPNDLKNLVINAFQSYLFNMIINLRVKSGASLNKPVKGDAIAILDDLHGSPSRVIHVYGAQEGYFDKYLDQAMELNRAVIIAPIIGYDTDMNEFPLVMSLINEFLEKEDIDLDMFKNEDLHPLDFKGSFRQINMIPRDLKIDELADDEEFQGKKKLRIDFSLLKGAYATMLLREFIK